MPTGLPTVLLGAYGKLYAFAQAGGLTSVAADMARGRQRTARQRASTVAVHRLLWLAVITLTAQQCLGSTSSEQSAGGLMVHTAHDCKWLLFTLLLCCCALSTAPGGRHSSATRILLLCHALFASAIGHQLQ
jgi:hypothetical protein